MKPTAFEKDVVEGLNASPKKLFSKYFYDEKGSALFQQIMQLPEYYLPACETAILEQKSSELLKELPLANYEVVELGAGDGTKTALFLEALIRTGKTIRYLPLDISPDILEFNRDFMKQRIPELAVEPIPGDYFHTLESIKTRKTPKIILFLGSNIGNFEGEKALEFISFVKKYLNEGDHFLLGVDLKKNPRTILAAYDDAAGITKQFNLNLLDRINRELAANFTPANFDHYASYNPVSGATTSYLISKQAQQVRVAGHTIDFKAFEPIHMEVSQKYSLDDLENIRENAGFHSVQHFTDSRDYFSISLFVV
ncbi:L-histidine N(alpha)-methyltransferase [Cyclobacterium xiamenense]|jgi:dimethylhistidine N-methyltransferase|uniref:L-histidine N(alpha)-methyltransferase n=1 Tax=Cyclobacterium xiamenense TaxID=1297121 RepID=UPI0012B944F4|nr:L-histidine N(alpha)-methyltransferase [Cyclobacterium xiamenense]